MSFGKVEDLNCNISSKNIESIIQFTSFKSPEKCIVLTSYEIGVEVKHKSQSRSNL